MWQKWAGSCKIDGICFVVVAVLLIQVVKLCGWASILVCVCLWFMSIMCMYTRASIVSSHALVLHLLCFCCHELSLAMDGSVVHVLEGDNAACLSTRNLSQVAASTYARNAVVAARSFSLWWMCLPIPHRLWLPCKAFLFQVCACLCPKSCSGGWMSCWAGSKYDPFLGACCRWKADSLWHIFCCCQAHVATLESFRHSWWSFHQPLTMKVYCVKLPKSRKRLMPSVIEPCLLVIFFFNPFHIFVHSCPFHVIPLIHFVFFLPLFSFQILCFFFSFFQFFIGLHEKKRLLLTVFMRSWAKSTGCNRDLLSNLWKAVFGHVT